MVQAVDDDEIFEKRTGRDGVASKGLDLLACHMIVAPFS